MRCCFRIVVVGFLTLAIGCNTSNDVISYTSKDGELIIRLQSSTAFMTIDESGVKRVGIKALEQMNGEKQSALYGFECAPSGGIYTSLIDDNDKGYETVTFDSGKWVRGGGVFMDKVAAGACDIGEKIYDEDHKH